MEYIPLKRVHVKSRFVKNVGYSGPRDLTPPSRDELVEMYLDWAPNVSAASRENHLKRIQDLFRFLDWRFQTYIKTYLTPARLKKYLDTTGHFKKYVDANFKVRDITINDIAKDDIAECMRRSGGKYPALTIDTLTADDLQDYKKNFLTMQRERKQGKKIVTYRLKEDSQRAYITTIRSFFSWYSGKYGGANIAAKFKAPSKKSSRNVHTKLRLNDEQCIKILYYFKDDPRKFSLFLTVRLLGLRSIEVERACVGDFSFRKNSNGEDVRVMWVQSKGSQDKDDWIQVPDEVWAAYQNYLQAERPNAQPDEPLYSSKCHRCTRKEWKQGRKYRRFTGRMIVAPLKATSIRMMFKEALEAIGIPRDDLRYSLHSLRHSFVCSWYEQTGDIYLTQAAARHCNPVTTEIYMHDLKDEARLSCPAAGVIAKKLTKDFNLSGSEDDAPTPTEI